MINMNEKNGSLKIKEHFVLTNTISKQYFFDKNNNFLIEFDGKQRQRRKINEEKSQGFYQKYLKLYKYILIGESFFSCIY